MNSGFLDKLIERIGRVRPEEVQNYLHRLADEKGFLETIFNAIHEGVVVTDLKGRINYLNRAACELFGLERENCMGEALAERLRGLEWKSSSKAIVWSAATWRSFIRNIAFSTSTWSR